jgi:hypothetical protein
MEAGGKMTRIVTGIGAPHTVISVGSYCERKVLCFVWVGEGKWVRSVILRLGRWELGKWFVFIWRGAEMGSFGYISRDDFNGEGLALDHGDERRLWPQPESTEYCCPTLTSHRLGAVLREPAPSWFWP